MSTFYVNTAYPLFVAYDGSPVIPVDVSSTDPRLDLDTRDAESAPSVEDLLPGALSLWPRGAAWGTPDGMAASTDTVIAKTTRAMLSPFADLYRRLWALTDESRAGTLVDSLEDWERDFGLPEPCVTEPQSVETRKRHLRAKVASDGTISPEDFVRLAADLGFVVAIEEPDAFRCGESSCGSYDRVSDVVLEQQWIVHLLDIPLWYFRTGEGEAGITRLLDFDIDALECVIRRVAPAWTYPFFNVAGWPKAFAIQVATDTALATEDGFILISPDVLSGQPF